jgi:hypothetical protein
VLQTIRNIAINDALKPGADEFFEANCCVALFATTANNKVTLKYVHRQWKEWMPKPCFLEFDFTFQKVRIYFHYLHFFGRAPRRLRCLPGRYPKSVSPVSGTLTFIYIFSVRLNDRLGVLGIAMTKPELDPP